MRGYIILEKLTAPYTVYSSLPEIVWGAFFQSPTRNIHASLSCNYLLRLQIENKAINSELYTLISA